MALDVAVTPEITQALSAGAVVAIGVSGGKDSQATAIRLNDYLNAIKHTGPRLLIHSDLGVVEWRDSLPVCERLARRLNMQLVVLRRGAGDLMDRWETRWANNVARYAELSCVKLILPWSTPGMRFCTSELKTDLICRELTKRYPGQTILSVTGIRHDESASRAKAPVASVQPKLAARGCTGWNWNPIIEWLTPAVYSYLEEVAEPLHEAYTRYGSTRVSCSYCIMGSIGDLRASASCPDNAEIYRRMVALEIRSTFGLQGSRWLGDVAPELLSEAMRADLARAKAMAAERNTVEARIPAHLLYTRGWPAAVPSDDEAQLLAEIRATVARLVGIEIGYTEAGAVQERYRALMMARPTAPVIPLVPAAQGELFQAVC